MTATDPGDSLRAALMRPAGPSSDFDLNPSVKPRAGRALRAAAVLVAVVTRQSGPQVYLTKRSSRLNHHPGQIAFPGGRVDPGDVDLEATALREAQEEIGLPPDKVDPIGRLPVHETVTGFVVTPILARITHGFDPVAEAGEVEEIFTVPLAHLMDPARYRVERRLWLGEWRHYYAVPFGPYYIWGATACILRGLAERTVR
jgi:8-oxo-dGTP pyrophosphatase MutT (NUDIX family)